MSQSPPPKQNSPFQTLIGIALLAFLLHRFPPQYYLPDPFHRIAYVLGSLVIAVHGLKLAFLVLSKLSNDIRSAQAMYSDNTKGSALWLSETMARKLRFHRRKTGDRFIGILGSTALWLTTETAHLIIGPAGSQKTSAAITNILLGNKEPALISDVKGELWETTRAHRKRAFGHRCVKIDPKDPENSVCINPLDPIIRTLLGDDPAALTWADGMAAQLHPDPKGGNNQNQFFYDGARDILSTVFLCLPAILPSERCTMDVAYRTIFDTDLLHDLMDAAMLHPALKGEVAARAKDQFVKAFGDAGQEKTFEQFRMGAVMAMKPFGPGNYLAAISQESTVSFKDLKSENLSIYLIIDFANTEVLGKFSGLLQWMAAMELVEVGNNKPVLFVLDECCNAPIHILPKIMTLLRSYGVKLILATQDHDDFVRVYDKHALETVLSETDIKQYLGGIKAKATLEYLSKMLGEYTEVAANTSLDPRAMQQSVSKGSRRLATEDEIRRMPDGAQIVLHANHPPIICKKVQVFAITPWRRQISPNSMYGGKRKLMRPELRIGWWRTRVTPRGARLSRRILRTMQERTPSPWSRARNLLISRLMPVQLILILVLGSWLYTQGLPNIRVDSGSGSAQVSPGAQSACLYLGPTNWGWVSMTGPCPHILWKKTW
ncbi:MAG: type IV secretory system conjugative DNA transfer family protein [Mangrovicoccus sp.]